MKFSIIIPAYNAANHIRNALDSVAAQTFENYELIVVCDSCTDNTEEIAQSYGARTDIVEYHCDGTTRNRGMELARGDYILFMDDDDWFLHEFVFEQIHAAMTSAQDIDVLLFSFIWKHRGYCTQAYGERRIACWAKCWRREFIGDTRFPAVPHWSDVDFDNAMFAKPGKIGTWDMPMYYYNYLREGSISWRKEQGEIE